MTVINRRGSTTATPVQLLGSMAAIRGLSLAKINKIIVEFSCFDEGVTSARSDNNVL